MRIGAVSWASAEPPRRRVQSTRQPRRERSDHDHRNCWTLAAACGSTDWTATRDTLHMWTQIVGKIRLAQAPMVNHWWQVTLYVTPRGLDHSADPVRRRAFDIEFDFVDHRLRIRASDGGSPSGAARAASRSPSSTPRSWRRWRELGLATADPGPTQRGRAAIPFDQDTEHASYDPPRRAPVLAPAGAGQPRHRRVPLRASSARSARCTSSGARWTWPAPGSPGGPRRGTPAAHPTAPTG